MEEGNNAQWHSYFNRYKETNFFGETILEHEYEYFCYYSNLNEKDGKALHELYKKRAESENWIEQIKNQLHLHKS